MFISKIFKKGHVVFLLLLLLTACFTTDESNSSDPTPDPIEKPNPDPSSDNQAPILDFIEDIIVTKGQTITFNPTAFDSDNDELNFSYSGWMSTDSYTTKTGETGGIVVVTVGDGNGGSDSQDVKVTVRDFLPAFPGAEGFGARTIGGRGGQIVKVTNLNDSGPGSLRAAVEAPVRNYLNGTYVWESMEAYTARLEASGHRIVVFEVSGIINLEESLDITYPFMTIAGETSPGGILITGRQTTIKTHEVIMRHMRFRVGSHRIADGADPETLDSFGIWGDYWGPVPVYNIIVDHSSFSWGVDENVTISGGVTNTTVQWSIVSEGLSHAGHPNGEHSKGLMVSGKYEYDNSVSLHHNYIAHNTDRNPIASSPDNVDTIVDIVNNVSYNWYGALSPRGGETAKINWIYNYAKQGLDSSDYSYEVAHNGTNPSPQLFIHGNIGSTRLSQSDPHWNVGTYYHNEDLPTSWQRSDPWDVPSVTATEMSYDYALEILNSVGATAPVRDSVDARVIADFANGTGTIIDNVIFPDDFPTFENLPVPTDSDNDGMADSWEGTMGFSVGADDSTHDHDGDGYTNIEEYLHYLAADN